LGDFRHDISCSRSDIFESVSVFVGELISVVEIGRESGCGADGVGAGIFWLGIG
jgi:hypothetical protein